MGRFVQLPYLIGKGVNKNYVAIGGVKWATSNLITNTVTGINYFAASPEIPGSIFQYGRCYGASPDSTTTATGKLTIAQGQLLSNADKVVGNTYVSSPATYYYHWCSEASNATYVNLWGDETTKGEYDPCPEGWRVPTEREMNLLLSYYRGLTTYNGAICYEFGENEKDVIYLPLYQKGHTWGINTFAYYHNQLYSPMLTSTLDSFNVPYMLRYTINISDFQLVAGFGEGSGGIRAIKI